MPGYKKWLSAISLLAFLSYTPALQAKEATDDSTPNARACREALVRSRLPSTGRMVVQWNTRGDLRTGLVSRNWNYFLRVSACSGRDTKYCLNLAESSYAPGAEILDGNLNIFLRIPVQDIGCLLLRKQDTRGIGIILTESGYIYNEYSFLGLVDFDRLRGGLVEIEVPTAGNFRIYFE